MFIRRSLGVGGLYPPCFLGGTKNDYYCQVGLFLVKWSKITRREWSNSLYALCALRYAFLTDTRHAVLGPSVLRGHRHVLYITGGGFRCLIKSKAYSQKRVDFCFSNSRKKV